MHNIDSKTIHFVSALPQVDLKEVIWMQPSIGFQVDIKTKADYESQVHPDIK